MKWTCECGSPHNGSDLSNSHPLPKKPDWYGITRLNHPSYPGPYSDLRDLGWVYDYYGHRETVGPIWHSPDPDGCWYYSQGSGKGWGVLAYFERERDIRWKNQALHQLGLVGDSAPSCAAHGPSNVRGPGAGGSHGL